MFARYLHRCPLLPHLRYLMLTQVQIPAPFTDSMTVVQILYLLHLPLSLPHKILAFYPLISLTSCEKWSPTTKAKDLRSLMRRWQDSLEAGSAVQKEEINMAKKEAEDSKVKVDIL